MNRQIDLIKQMSLGTKTVIVCVLIAVLAVAVLSTRGCVSRSKDAALEKREAVRAEEREKLESERDAAIGRAQAAEKREIDLRVQVTIQETAAAAAGAQAVKIAEGLKQDDEKYNQEMRDADVDVSYCERIKRICARATKLYPNRKAAQECANCQ